MASKATQQALGSSSSCCSSMDLCRRPPKRPQKKRSLLSVVDDNDENEHHQQEQKQQVETTSTTTMQADHVADSCNETTRQLLATTARRKIPLDKNTTTTTTTTTALTGSSLLPRVSTHNHDNNADAVPQRLLQQQHHITTTAGVASRRQDDDDFFLVHCRKIQALSTTTPNAQLRAYWKLVYGDDTPQPIQKKTNTTCQQRSVLKRPNNKRSRHGGTDLSLSSSTTLPDGSFDSPQQQQSAHVYSYWTPQAAPSSTTTTTRRRVVQFGPSSGVSFTVGTPVAGGLQPLSAAEVPTGEGSDNDNDDEEEALRETKANAAVLAAWEAMEQHDDQEEEEETSRRRWNDRDTTTTTLGHRPARRSSTLFSPHSKNLLQESPPVNRNNDDEEEDSDDANDESEPPSNHDPVNHLPLSELQVHSPTLVLHGNDDEEKVATSLSDTTIVLKVSPSESSKQGEGNQEAPSDVVDAMVQSPQQHSSVPFSNENVLSPNACYGHDDASGTEPEPFCWQQLLPNRQSPAEWMLYYQTSHPLRMLLAQALTACADNLHRGKVVVGCLYEPSLLACCTRSRELAEMKLMQDLCQQLETRQQSMLALQGETLEEAWRAAFSMQSPLLLPIARLESDIAVLENAVAREAKALALSHQRKLTLHLKCRQRQQVEWTALSSLLSGNVAFPREDEAGLVYAFPVQKLACEVILRPNDHGALGRANLNVTAGLATTDIPLEMAESFRRILSIKVVEMCQEQDFDFQQASRQVIVFLGRLDRILDDLICACRQWEHGLVRNLDDENAVSLQFQVTHTTWARLIWQITPLEPLVLEYAYPNRVELVQEKGTSVIVGSNSNPCGPPCLRSLWRTVAVHVNSNSLS